MTWERAGLIAKLLPHCGGDSEQAARVADDVLRQRGAQARRRMILRVTGAEDLLRDLNERAQAREEGPGRK